MLTLLAPFALVGLFVLAVPIAIHILAKRRAMRVPFPTLRFILPGRLASVRRHVLEDAALLGVRLAILAAAVLALAGPLIVTARRQAAWDARTQTVVVADPNLGDGIARAVRTLALAPPGRREIVVRSTFPIGSLTRTDLMVAAHVGLRFERTGTLTPARTVELPPVLTESGTRTRTMTVDRATTVREGGATAGVAPDQAADAQTAAVLAERVRAPLDGRRARVATAEAADIERIIASASPIHDAWIADALAVVSRDSEVKAASAQLTQRLSDARLTRSPWIVVANDADGQPLAAGGSVDGLLTIVSAAPADALVSAVLLRAAMNAIGDRAVPVGAETLSIPDEQLKAWTHAPGPAPAPRPDTLERDDRRWLWIAALLLLGVEWWMRRRRDPQSFVGADLGRPVTNENGATRVA